MIHAVIRMFTKVFKMISKKAMTPKKSSNWKYHPPSLTNSHDADSLFVFVILIWITEVYDVVSFVFALTKLIKKVKLDPRAGGGWCVHRTVNSWYTVVRTKAFSTECSTGYTQYSKVAMRTLARTRKVWIAFAKYLLCKFENISSFV